MESGWKHKHAFSTSRAGELSSRRCSRSWIARGLLAIYKVTRHVTCTRERESFRGEKASVGSMVGEIAGDTPKYTANGTHPSLEWSPKAASHLVRNQPDDAPEELDHAHCSLEVLGHPANCITSLASYDLKWLPRKLSTRLSNENSMKQPDRRSSRAPTPRNRLVGEWIPSRQFRV